MDNYNKYVTGDDFNSQIVFVNTKDPVVKKILYLVTFGDGKQDGFLDNGDHLKNYLINQLHNKEQCVKLYENIKSVSQVTKYYSIIKVIKDELNPQLEGQLLRFSYGRTMMNLIVTYLETNGEFKNIFNLVKGVQDNGYCRFSTYDKCFFKDSYCRVDDDTLVIETDFKTFVLPHIYYREKKINKIKEILKEKING